uniref:Reverse transcriptase domain-containing protein n=1 Tax=Cannabis sativa TaxID=3483 RepID=A0A803P2Z6_CANSA
MLRSIPGEEKIINTVAVMHPLKAPGLDGKPGCFYKNYWKITGKSVIQMVQTFFSEGRIQSQLNYTFICLILKGEDATSVEKFTPISLCNFAYKIISKIIATRLRAVMNKLVSPFQAAFIPSRWIAESSILTKELVQTIKKNKGSGGLMALKLDMHKIYDRMEWCFIKRVMEANDFDSQNKSFWEVEGKGGDSPLWKGILESRGIIQLGGLAILGRGDSIDIWNQPWIPWLNYNEFYDLLQRIKSSNPHLKTVADLSVQDNSWNLDLLQQLFGRDLGARIGLIPRLPASVEDTMVWKESTDEAFTVKRAHQERRTGRWTWYAKQNHASSVAEGKMQAIRWAFQLGLAAKAESIAIASNAKVIVQALEKKNCPPFLETRPIAMEILHIPLSFNVL